MVVAIQAGVQGQAIASGPVQALVWQLDQASFDGAVVELMRREDMVPIRLLLIRLPGEAAAAARRGDRDEFDAILDRLTSLGAIALTLERTDVAAWVIERLAEIYGAPSAAHPGTAARPLPQPVIWLDILARVVAMGGLAVFLKQWTVARELARQPSPDSWYASWLRHGLTTGYRSEAFPTTASGQPEQGALIPLARRVAHRLPALRPYAADDDGYDPEPGAEIPPADPILDSLCAFDALAALAVMTEIEPGRFDWSHYYPSFAHYYPRRSEPYWTRLLKNPAMREELLPGIDDDALGKAMSAVAEAAHKVIQGRWGLWSIEDETVANFIEGWRRREAERKPAKESGD
jgi:hypothetical protein